MPRTVDAELVAALAEGSGKPIITAYLGSVLGVASITATPISYKLTGTSLEFELPYYANNPYPAMWLTRGVEINGTQYTLTTGRFRTTRMEFPAGRIVAHGELFPPAYYAAAADDTYQNVIEAFCTAHGKTAVFKDPAAAWLAYKFFPTGKQIILNNANNFLNLLRQKYLIFAADNGDEEVLFYACDGALPAADVTYTPTADFARTFTYRASRLFMWRDELQTVHTDGTAGDPVHNLGYLETTATQPARHSVTWGSQIIVRPDLETMDGDCFALVFGGQTINGFALVAEEYTAPKAGHGHPRWFCTIESNSVFGNTEGGAMPSTIERVSNYTPLQTGSFDAILSSSDNNLQAAMETLDEHRHKTPVGGNLLLATVPAGTTWNWCPGTVAFSATTYNTPFPAGTIQALRMKTATGQPATGSLVVTVYVQNAASAITFTMAAGGAAGDYSDLTHTVHINAGDVVRIVFQNNAPAAVSAQIGAVGFEFLADT